MVSKEFIGNIISWLYSLGGNIIEASNEVISFLQHSFNVPGFGDVQMWQIFTTLFVAIYVPYTIIKWAIPI